MLAGRCSAATLAQIAAYAAEHPALKLGLAAELDPEPEAARAQAFVLGASRRRRRWSMPPPIPRELAENQARHGARGDRRAISRTS